MGVLGGAARRTAEGQVRREGRREGVRVEL